MTEGQDVRNSPTVIKAFAQGLRVAIVMIAGAAAFSIVSVPVHRLVYPATREPPGAPAQEPATPLLSDISKMAAFALVFVVPLAFIVASALAVMGPTWENLGPRVGCGAVIGALAGAFALGLCAAIYATMPVRKGELSLKPPAAAFVLFAFSGLIPGLVTGLVTAALFKLSQRSLLKGLLGSVAAFALVGAITGLIR